MTLIRTREDLGERNRRQVLSEILLNGPLPRTAIANRVGLTNASVSRITRDLINAGLIEMADTYASSSGRGRRFVALRIRPEGGYVAGIAVNAFRQDVVVADIGNRQLGQRRLALSNLDDPETVLKSCAEQLLQLLAETGIESRTLLGCGVTVAGAVDPDQGILRAAPAIAWQNVDIRSTLEPLLGVPLVIESIANAKHLAGHYFGPARNSGNTVLFNASLAVGASLLLDGHLIRGHQASAGLIEAMRVPDETTGALRPVDQVAGGYGAMEFAGYDTFADGQKAARGLIRLLDQAEAGDQLAGAALHQAGRNLGWIAGQATALLHPEKLVISGPLIGSQHYCQGLTRRIASLFDSVPGHVEPVFYPIDSIEAAQSLAVYHFLVRSRVNHGQLATAGGF